MPIPKTHDCHSCGREAALDAERCACGASFDPLLRASEAALESLEHKEYVVLEKGLTDDPKESGYRRSRLGKPKGQNRDYRLSAAFFEEGEGEEEEAEEAKETEGNDRTRLSFIDVSLPSSVSFHSFKSAGVPASVEGVTAPQFEFDVSIPSIRDVSLSSLKDIETPSFDDVSLPFFSNVSAPSFGGDDESEGDEDEMSQGGTDGRELHLREYDDRYTLHWDAHPATSPMHAVKDAPDYGAACAAAVGLAAAAVGSRVVKRRKE